MSDFLMHGPVKVEMKVLMISVDGETQGTATIGLGNGTYPTPQKIAESLESFSENDMPNLAPGYRLMNKRETWNHICMERAGETFALPGSNEWDQPPQHSVMDQLKALFDEALNYNSYLYFELGYHRYTEWMVHIIDKSGGGNKKLIQAQGDYQCACSEAVFHLSKLLKEWDNDQESE